MKKEVRIGILFFTAMLVLLVGYKYLQGKELFDDSMHYKARFDSVDKLEKSSKVYANGFQVGTVTDLYLDTEDPDYVVVELKVRPEIKLPEETRAVLVDEGVFGGKSLELRFDHICKDGPCIGEGEFIRTGKTGPLESFLGDPKQIERYVRKLGTGMDSLFQALSAQMDNPENKDKVTEMIRALHNTAVNLGKISADVQKITEGSSDNFNKMMANLNAITYEIRRNNHHIANTLTHLDSISGQLSAANLKQTVHNATKAIEELRTGLVSMRSTLKGVDKTVDQTTGLISSINRGEGTLGKLKRDSSLYIQLDKAINNLNKLMEDMRLHPKRYVHFSIFN